MAAARLLILIACLLCSALASARVLPLAAPAWAELDARQHEVLAPLEADWDGMTPVSRRKWLGICARYDRLSADEQVRIQVRMRDWARLNPDERSRARMQYRAMQKLPPDRRSNLHAEWERYQNLPPEGRRPEAVTPAPRRPGAALQGQVDIFR